MKIATWNVERPRNSPHDKNNKILEELKRINADILVLTETHSAIHPGDDYTPFVSDARIETSEDDVRYRQGENRVTIWVKQQKFPVMKRTETYNSRSAVCVCLKTDRGELNVYGTVIGYRGSRHKAFAMVLDAQIADWKRLCKSGDLCIVGDYNISFIDNHYYTKAGRKKLDECFRELNLELLTRPIEKNIDHVAISESFLKAAHPTRDIWNHPIDRKLSDHIGVCVTI